MSAASSSELATVITGGRGRGRTGRGAMVRAQADAGLPPQAPVTTTHCLGSVDQVHQGWPDDLHPAETVSVYEISAFTSADRPQVWLCLLWGRVDGRLYVVGVDGDSKGGVVEHAQRVAHDLDLRDAGMVTEGGASESGQRLAVTLAAVTVRLQG